MPGTEDSWPTAYRSAGTPAGLTAQGWTLIPENKVSTGSVAALRRQSRTPRTARSPAPDTRMSTVPHTKWER